jgi:hypothetical protein
VTPQVTDPRALACTGGLAFGGRNRLSPAPFSDEEKPMNVNSGKSWSEMDITDLKQSVDYGAYDRKDRGLPVQGRG